MSLTQQLLVIWAIFNVGGAFIGTLLAFGVRALYRKVVKWYNKED